MKFFQIILIRWDYLITFESILVLESSIVSPWLKYWVQSSRCRVKLGIWEAVFFPVSEEIVYSFLVYYFLGKRVWFVIIFLPLSSRQVFFAIPSLILSHLELSRIVTKVNFKYFNENFAEAWLFLKVYLWAWCIFT